MEDDTVVDNYDDLIKTLENNGLVRGEDFYVWNYDWRKRVGAIVTDLDEFVDNNVFEDEKVDFVGHSLGGLVARIWAQDNIGDSRLGKVISLGSPHNGTISAYEAWVGGKISDTPNIQSIGLNLLLQLQKKNFSSHMDTIRGFAPVLQDLSPTFEFIKKNNKIIGLNNLSLKNNYLSEKNIDEAPSLKPIVGINTQTKEWINVKERDVFDKVLGIWADGKPLKYTLGRGDGTILKKSAMFNGNANHLEVESNHSDIVDKSIETILSELNIGGEVGSLELDKDLSDYLIFFVGSPAEMSVNCDNNGSVEEMDGFVFIKNNNFEKCVVDLMAIGNGTYHLVSGNTNNMENWNFVEDEISLGEDKKIIIDAKNGEIVVDDNVDLIYELIKRDVDLLKVEFENNKNLVNLDVGITNRDLDKIILNAFGFRKETKENKISKRIIENIEKILVWDNRNVSQLKARSMYMKALSSNSLLDSLTRLKTRYGNQPNDFMALSYINIKKLTEELKGEWKLNNYSKVVAKSILVSKYLNEIW